MPAMISRGRARRPAGPAVARTPSFDLASFRKNGFSILWSPHTKTPVFQWENSVFLSPAIPIIWLRFAKSTQSTGPTDDLPAIGRLVGLSLAKGNRLPPL